MQADVDINIGEIIRQALKKQDMTQAQLAKEMNVSGALVSAWVRDQRFPTGKDIVRLAIFLGIIPDLFPGYGKLDYNFDPQQAHNSKYYRLTKDIEELRRTDRLLEKKLKRLEKILSNRLFE